MKAHFAFKPSLRVKGSAKKCINDILIQLLTLLSEPNPASLDKAKQNGGGCGRRELLQKNSVKAKCTLLLEHKILGTGLYGDLKMEILATVNLSLRGSSQICV